MWGCGGFFGSYRKLNTETAVEGIVANANTFDQYSAGNTAQGGTWNNPTAVFNPRFARVNFTVNF